MGLLLTELNDGICHFFKNQDRKVSVECELALELLEKIKSSRSLEMSIALALVNALKYEYVLCLPEDEGTGLF